MKLKILLVPGSALLLSLTLFTVAWAKPSMDVSDGRSLLVRADGTLWQWGIHGGIESAFPQQVGKDHDWDRVSVSDHILAVKSDGTLWGWGSNATPTRIGTSADWADVKAGSGFSLALKKDGTLWGWGDRLPGRTWSRSDYAPHQFGSDGGWVAISAGDRAILALKADGTLWAWGRNVRGALGVGDHGVGDFLAEIPPTVVGSGGWAAVATNENFTLALKRDGSLWGWGWNVAGQLGPRADSSSLTLTPMELTSKKGWVAVAVGCEHSLGLQADGSLWAWGRNDFGQGGVGNGDFKIDFTQVGAAKDWLAIAAGGRASAGMKANGEMYSWGFGFLGTNTPRTSSLAAIADPGNWKMMDAGSAFSVGVRNDGSLWSWGRNDFGVLGLGDTLDRFLPARVGTDSWQTVDSGSAHTLAVREDGTLWSWGYSTIGELGRELGEYDGTWRSRVDANPGRVEATGPWAMISAGQGHSLALKQDGTLWAWGRNTEGQLGIGLDASGGLAHPLPVQVGSDSDWKQISAGFWFSVAVKKDGTLWAWGRLLSGPAWEFVSVPTQVGDESDWASANAGYEEITALKTDGTLWRKTGNDPRQVPHPEGKTWAAVSPGYRYALALSSDGALWYWGFGHGLPGASAFEPSQIGTDTDWKLMAATPWSDSKSTPHTLVLKDDSTLHAWGDNYHGQLGNGSSGYLLIPTRIPETIPAGPHSIGGFVRDRRGRPLAGIGMTLKGRVNQTVVTDARGRFKLAGLFSGRYGLRASQFGFVFRPSRLKLKIDRRNVVRLRFTGRHVRVAER